MHSSVVWKFCQALCIMPAHRAAGRTRRRRCRTCRTSYTCWKATSRRWLFGRASATACCRACPQQALAPCAACATVSCRMGTLLDRAQVARTDPLVSWNPDQRRWCSITSPGRRHSPTAGSPRTCVKLLVLPGMLGRRQHHQIGWYSSHACSDTQAGHSSIQPARLTCGRASPGCQPMRRPC